MEPKEALQAQTTLVKTRTKPRLECGTLRIWPKQINRNNRLGELKSDGIMAWIRKEADKTSMLLTVSTSSLNGLTIGS